MKPFYQTIFFSQSNSLSIYMKRKNIHPLSLSLSLSLTSIPSLSSFSFLPFNTFPPLLSHETFLSDDLFSSQSDSLSIYMKRRKNIHLSLSLSLSLSNKISTLSLSLSLSLSLFYNVHSFSLFFLPSLPFNTFPPYYLMKPFYQSIFFSQSDSLSIYMKGEKIHLSLSLSLSLSFKRPFPSLFLPSYPSIHFLPYYLMKPFYRSIFFSSQSDSLSIYMKRKNIHPLSLSLSLSLFQRPFLLSLLSPFYPSIHSLPYYLMKPFYRFSFSLSLSLSLLSFIHSFSLFFLPSYPSIHFLPYYLMKPFYRSIFFSSQSDSLSIYMKRKKSTLSLSLSLSFITSIPSLSSFSFLPFNTFPPLLSHETFLSVDLLALNSLSLLHEKRKYPKKSLSLFLSSIPSLSSFSFLPFNIPPYYLMKPFYQSIFLALSQKKYPPSLSLSLSLFFHNVLSFSLFFLPSYPSIHSLSYYLMRPFYRRKYPLSLSLSLSLSFITSFPSLLSLQSPFLNLQFLAPRKISTSLSLSLSLSLFYNVHSFSLFFLLPTLQYISLPYYLMKPFYRTSFLALRKNIHSLSLSLSLSLSFLTSIPSLFLSPFLPFNTFPPLLSHETFLSVDLFSSQSDSLSIYMKRRKYPLSLSLSLSLSFITSIPSLSSFSLPTLQYIPSLLSLFQTFLSVDLFSSQSDSLSIYMKRKNILSLSLSLSLFS
ncbi:unnamed protein product [Acanthosepion pharaonis]|uniref:Uncharacterized protein n=1 Tax=Acanthosepion pharaonis TaxID=158019 RepID=A0A812EKF3_ACAPH|nr:unnamed protein product [Sepia pharaonis]